MFLRQNTPDGPAVVAGRARTAFLAQGLLKGKIRVPQGQKSEQQAMVIRLLLPLRIAESALLLHQQLGTFVLARIIKRSCLLLTGGSRKSLLN
jgi:hypothetical protein